jgi:uncharacterized membrane protein YhaH (DUF805 family)
MKWYLAVFSHYAVFRGRSGGLEFWIFFLFQLVIMGGLFVLGLATHQFLPYLVYVLISLLPYLGLVVRRLHDTGRSGFWVFITLVPLVGQIVLLLFMADEGERQPNRYGPEPDRLHPPLRPAL